MVERLEVCVIVCVGVMLAACRSRSVERASVETSTSFPAPTDDRGLLCLDVGAMRACWENGRSEPATVRRPLPSIGAPTALGWRCTGQGAARVCVDRVGSVGTFVCKGADCQQLHPRLPDDGEWSCADDAGAVVCVGSEPPAGVVPGAVEAGWICGERAPRAPLKNDPGRRVCVDLSPDYPDGRPASWRCRFDQERGHRRVCTRDLTVHALGDACDDLHPCLDGALCVSARCLPRRPMPSCWLDGDCRDGVCRFGSCVGAAS